jgi:pyruvate-formate lyase
MALFVSLAFKQYSDDKLVSFSHTVFQRMSTDPQYGAFKSFVDEVNSKNDRLIVCVADAKLGGKDRYNNRDIAKLNLLKVLTRLATEIQNSDNDNERFITDAGFEVRNFARGAKKTTFVVKELDVPILTAINLDHMGCAETKWNEIPNALLYALQHREKGETVWQNGDYNHIGEFTFTNLESDKVYEFQIRALGPFSTSSAWSPTVTIYVS